MKKYLSWTALVLFGLVLGLVACHAVGRITGPGSGGMANPGGAGGNMTGSGGAAGEETGGIVGGGTGGMPNNSTGEVGQWEDVTPRAGSGFSPGQYGPQTMLADPARPGTFYFASASSGVFKSTDFAKSWTKISAQTLVYGCGADPNPRRDPNTPMPMFCGGGYGNGVARSVDNGVTWRTFKTNNTRTGSDVGFQNDTYSFDVNPYDNKHILVGFHGNPGLSESTDGGMTYRTVMAVDGRYGSSLYPFFIDTGNPATTRGNWLIMPQWGSQGGIARTTDAGATWSITNSLQHGHGNAQIFGEGKSGVVYAAGLSGSEGHGVYRSADFGMTWTKVNDGTPQNGVYGTPNFVYADYGWATGAQPQTLQRAPRATGTAGTWTNYYPNAPMRNGSGRAAVAYDGSIGKYVIVLGAWTAGIWRYIEP